MYISVYLYNFLYTWKPNDPCFHWKLTSTQLLKPTSSSWRSQRWSTGIDVYGFSLTFSHDAAVSSFFPRYFMKQKHDQLLKLQWFSRFYSNHKSSQACFIIVQANKKIHETFASPSKFITTSSLQYDLHLPKPQKLGDIFVVTSQNKNWKPPASSPGCLPPKQFHKPGLGPPPFSEAKRPRLNSGCCVTMKSERVP